MPLQFGAKHDEKESQLKSLKELLKWQSKVHISYDDKVTAKRTPQDSLSGTKDIQLPIALPQARPRDLTRQLPQTK